MKVVKKVVTLLIILTVLFQVILPSNVRAQNEGNSLYDIVAKNAVLDNIRSEYVDSDTGIDFTKGASSTNGRGVYTVASTKDDLYPIHYYRGNVDNNNVLFGGFCWQIVRTTETGGVKIIYNGSPDENGKCENPEIDVNLQTDNMQPGAYMNGITGEDYSNLSDFMDQFFNDYNNALYSDWVYLALMFSEDIDDSYYDNLINEEFYYSEDVEYSKETNTYALRNAQEHKSGDSIDNIKGKNPIYFCDNTKNCSDVNLIIWDTYYEEDNSVGSFVLSNGMTYDDVEQIRKQNLIFANDVEYKNGKYQLKNTISIPLEDLNNEENIKKVLDGHHYLCDNFSNSCDWIGYIYNYEYDDYFDYYEFDVIMFENGTTGKDIYNAFNLNENDSKMKKVIDKWYSSNLTDNTKYLEDTIWCNDRSKNFNIFNKDYNLLNNSVSAQSCPNKNDRFTVSSKNGNGKLTYPVATITGEEVVYAGSPSISAKERTTAPIVVMISDNYLSFYSEDFLTMTPLDHETKFYVVNEYGELDQPDNYCNRPKSIKSNSIMPMFTSCESKNYVRPMVSLKHSMIVTKGDGSPSNPYELIEGDTADVEYVIDGDMPDGFVSPEVGSYLKGSKVRLDSLKAGDIVNGYRFLGWQSEDVEVVDGVFNMPGNKVVFIGKFEKIIESPPTYDDITKYISTGVIAVLGLAGVIILKKKFITK